MCALRIKLTLLRFVPSIHKYKMSGQTADRGMSEKSYT